MRRICTLNARKVFVSITLLVAVVFSFCNVVPPVTADPAKYLMQEVLPAATTDVIDYGNGTTLTIINYPDGSRDEISETLLPKTEYKLPDGTTDQSLSVELPTSTEESTEYFTVTADPVLQQEVLMGFTYSLVSLHYDIVDITIGDIFLKTRVQLWVDFDILFGLRLPVRITLEYPEQMTVGQDYPFYATLTPLNRPSYDELLFQFDVVVYLQVKEYDILTGWTTIIDEAWGESFDWSRDFSTPIGPGMSFPGLPTGWYSIVDEVVLSVDVGSDSRISPDKVTARASTGGDATGAQTLTWSAPSQRIEFNVHAEDYDPGTDDAHIQLSDFRYYFSIFELELDLDIEFKTLLEWIPDLIFNIWTFDLSKLTDELYVGVHAGTGGTIDVDVFVKKFGVGLVITPPSQDIVAGDTATYNVLIINIGNIDDTFDLTIAGLPSTWWYEFASTAIPVSADDSASTELSIIPELGAPPGDYPFTVTATSQEAPLHDAEATVTETAVVGILPAPPAPLFSDALRILPVVVLAGALVVLRRRRKQPPAK